MSSHLRFHHGGDRFIIHEYTATRRMIADLPYRYSRSQMLWFLAVRGSDAKRTTAALRHPASLQGRKAGQDSVGSRLACIVIALFVLRRCFDIVLTHVD